MLLVFFSQLCLVCTIFRSFNTIFRSFIIYLYFKLIILLFLFKLMIAFP